MELPVELQKRRFLTGGSLSKIAMSDAVYIVGVNQTRMRQTSAFDYSHRWFALWSHRSLRAAVR
jgi:hypothetical protein